MKAQFLKIAKCKDEKSFYKKYPTQEAFFKAHPEARSIKKAQIGAYIGGDTMANAEPISYQTYYDDADKLITGSTEKERQEAAYKEQELKANKASSSGIESLLGMISGGAPGGGEEGDDIMSMLGEEEGGSVGEGIMSSGGFGAIGGGIGRNGKYIPKAQEGDGLVSLTDEEVENEGGKYDGYAFPGGPNTNSAGFVNNALKAVPVVGGLVSGIQALGAEKEAAKAAKQQRTVSGLQLTASATRPEQIQRRYVRPEDVAIQPNQMFPTYGVGTNVLARDGVRLRGGGEIQNTYAPDYLYDDLGYEPLNDSNVKQYYRGGGIPKAAGGFSNYMNSLSGGGSGFSGAGEAGSTPWGAIGSTAAGMAGETNAGGNIGGTVGGALGSAFGPAGNAVGTFVGTIAGNALDPYAKKIKRDQAATKRNIENIAYNKMAPSLIAPYQAHARNGRNIANYEEGGWVSHDWQPQVIASFGGLDEQEVYDYAHDGMQSLRAGGHVRGEYTPISNRGMEQYAMGGEVKTTWGGHAETISHNPYMPGTGETIMFRGKSHDESDGNGNTGIGVKYGKGAKDSYTDYAEYGAQEADADVEVERGEPAAELQDANGEKNLTVYGNLKIPNQYIDLLGDPNAKGKKFKNYVNDLSKIEAKQNKIVESSTNKLNALNPQTQFDKLKLTSLQASIEGANMKLKDLADKKMNAAYLQNAINDTAEENGLVADDLARGKVKFDTEAPEEYARYGKSISKAQDGDQLWKGKNIKRQFKITPSVTRYVYEGNIIVDRDDKGKILTSKKATANDVIDYNYDEKDNHYTKTFGNNNKRSYYTNGRMVELNPKGQRIRKGNYDNTTDKVTKWDKTDAEKSKATAALTKTQIPNISDLADQSAEVTRNAQAQQQAAYRAPAPVSTTQPTTTKAPEKQKAAQVPVKKAPVATTPAQEEYTSKYGFTPWSGNKLGLKEKTKSAFSAKEWDDIADNLGFKGKGNKEFQQFLLNNPEAAPIIKSRHMALYGKDPSTMLDEKLGFGWAAPELKSLSLKPASNTTPDAKKTDTTKKEEDKVYPVEAQKRNPWLDLAGQVLPFFRPTDQEGIDYDQLMGEMYALSNNQVEPVQAQSYQPDLATPYDISYQDQLNANQADYNSMQKMVGYNPAAQSILNAQKYAANTGVLGEQFRANQAMKMGVYDQNRQTLNDAKFKNLSIFDQQYERQEQAKSNTKAITQAALNSISDKYAKNKLENRELGIYENLYNYRYDAQGRAINMNAPWQANIPTVSDKGNQTANMRAVYDQKGNFIRWERIKQDETTTESDVTPIPPAATNPTVPQKKYGGSTKAKNGSIVSAYKNL